MKFPQKILVLLTTFLEFLKNFFKIYQKLVIFVPFIYLSNFCFPAQVDVDSSSLPAFEDELSSSSEFEVLMDMSPSVTETRHWLKRELDISDCESEFRKDVKRHCPDDEEINAQVQSAIDSILNLQRSDPATDEAVRSILPS